MLWLYRILFLPVLAVLSPYYVVRMRRRGGYAHRFGERFGSLPALPPPASGVRRLWVQAVSVGEVLAVGPLLEAWSRDPSLEVVLTTTTSTGMALAEERYSRWTRARAYFPIDAWPCSRRAWSRLRPDLAVLVEGELWPEHLAQARFRGVPVVCLNARMSDRSFRRLRRLRPVARPLLAGLSRVLAGSGMDAARFREVGVPAAAVRTTGNLKFDVTIPRLSAGERNGLRASLGLPEGESVLLGSSTWPGEEAALLQAFAGLRRAGLPGRLLLVPRHAERRQEVIALLEASGLSHHVRSRGAAGGAVDVALADTTGELRALTQLGDVVFVGKSLPPHHEGQTPIEAASLGKPLLFGPRLSNFRDAAQQLVAAGAARSVANAGDLEAEVRALWQAPERRRTMAAGALQWHAANQGALARTLAEVAALLDSTPAR
jgi:3-deoxy-D-manno-octulosonic-acid transferase